MSAQAKKLQELGGETIAGVMYIGRKPVGQWQSGTFVVLPEGDAVLTADVAVAAPVAAPAPAPAPKPPKAKAQPASPAAPAEVVPPADTATADPVGNLDDLLTT